MEKTQAWKNFNLGQELSISGAFIYNGLRRFYEMQMLDNTDEIFEVFYNLSVGLERLLKIAVVMVEHNDATDQDKFEKTLITHNHLELLQRVKKYTNLHLDTPHNEFLGLLGTFYKTLRYDRFNISSVYHLDRERKKLYDFIEKNLQVNLEPASPLFGTPNDIRYQNYIRKIVIKISSVLYDVIKAKAYTLNLYTYELRHGSKAETIFLGQADLPSENILWKELLIFFMNTKSSSGLLKFLRSIDPLDFDPEAANDYLECFKSDAAKAFVIDELEYLYSELKDKKERFEIMQHIGNPNIIFDSDWQDFEDEHPS